MAYCYWCNINRDYYPTDENASRQNCMVSDSGYHEFVHFNFFRWVSQCFKRKTKKDELLTHRRIKHRHTI